jgi:hypothetical protein
MLLQALRAFLLFASMIVASEQVSPWEGAGKSLLYHIRPPPRLQLKDLNP